MHWVLLVCRLHEYYSNTNNLCSLKSRSSHRTSSRRASTSGIVDSPGFSFWPTRLSVYVWCAAFYMPAISQQAWSGSYARRYSDATGVCANIRWWHQSHRVSTWLARRHLCFARVLVLMSTRRTHVAHASRYADNWSLPGESVPLLFSRCARTFKVTRVTYY